MRKNLLRYDGFLSMSSDSAKQIYEFRREYKIDRPPLTFNEFLSKHRVVIFNNQLIGGNNKKFGFLHVGRLMMRRNTRYKNKKKGTILDGNPGK